MILIVVVMQRVLMMHLLPVVSGIRKDNIMATGIKKRKEYLRASAIIVRKGDIMPETAQREMLTVQIKKKARDQLAVLKRMMVILLLRTKHCLLLIYYIILDGLLILELHNTFDKSNFIIIRLCRVQATLYC
jgi:hypothetical protein